MNHLQFQTLWIQIEVNAQYHQSVFGHIQISRVQVIVVWSLGKIDKVLFYLFPIDNSRQYIWNRFFMYQILFFVQVREA